ncbi:GNAT family protein [Roseicella aquatilis]|uniref:GNAT family N-acetyltransferase n=1 Tax=Roseicella aquatilis TaxID=2527868 RepID=UPI0010455FEF|nr:GNAT family N-acetyltransferase [Roseicella aquatilis]
MTGTGLPARLDDLDLGRVVAFGAVAGNAIIATACAVPGPEGVGIGVTEDPRYRDRGLGEMLLSQVLGARPAATGTGPAEAGSLLLRCMACLGGRVLPLTEFAGTT